MELIWKKGAFECHSCCGHAFTDHSISEQCSLHTTPSIIKLRTLQKQPYVVILIRRKGRRSGTITVVLSIGPRLASALALVYIRILTKESCSRQGLRVNIFLDTNPPKTEFPFASTYHAEWNSSA